MVKDLYLLRHGQAAQDFNISDKERPLTTKGVNQLTSLGINLKQKGFYPDRIYCSTAKRTRQTVEIITEQVDYMLPVDYREEIYEASVRTLFQLVSSLDEETQTALIVGHNPGISYFFDYLTEANHGGLNPGDMVRVEFQDQQWSEITKGSGSKKEI